MFEKKTVLIHLERADNRAIVEIPESRVEILFRAFTLSSREDGKTEIVFSITFPDKIVNSPLALYDRREDAESDLKAIRERLVFNKDF